MLAHALNRRTKNSKLRHRTSSWILTPDASTYGSFFFRNLTVIAIPTPGLRKGLGTGRITSGQGGVCHTGIISFVVCGRIILRHLRSVEGGQDKGGRSVPVPHSYLREFKGIYLQGPIPHNFGRRCNSCRIKFACEYLHRKNDTRVNIHTPPWPKRL